MAASKKKTKKIRKRKHTRMGKSRKRKLRREGSTPNLDRILGPLSK